MSAILKFDDGQTLIIRCVCGQCYRELAGVGGDDAAGALLRWVSYPCRGLATLREMRAGLKVKRRGLLRVVK